MNMQKFKVQRAFRGLKEMRRGKCSLGKSVAYESAPKK